MKHVTAEVPGERRRHELIAQWVTGLEESLAYHEGVVLDKLTTTRKGTQWQLVVTGRRMGKPLVAFFTCPDIHECYNAMAQAMRQKRIDWRADKFAKSQ